MAEIRPWLAHYDPDVPATLEPYPERTLLHYLSESASTHPDSPALLFKGRQVSYAELERESDAFAAALAASGVEPEIGSRCACLTAHSSSSASSARGKPVASRAR